MDINKQANPFSKEVIKTRMLHNAATLWGVNNIANLDPFVKLLVDAFSTEIFNVSNQVSDMQVRLLEKLSHLLVPSIYALPHVAHGILYASCADPFGVIENSTTFSYKPVNNSAKNGNEEIRFTPVDKVKLVGGDIKYIAVGNGIYAVPEPQLKRPLQKSQQASLEYGAMWLGIELDPSIRELDELCLYFSNSAYDYHDWLYTLLCFTEITIGNEKLRVTKGTKYYPEKQANGYAAIFESANIYKKISENVKHFYEDYFITVDHLPALDKMLNVYPDELQQAGITKDILQRSSTTNILWLKCKFLPNYLPDMLENFQVSLNAFPVFNRSYKNVSHIINAVNNIIPLTGEGDESFFMMEKLETRDGMTFKEIPYTQSGEPGKGYYALRKSGVERFDERDALDLMNYMLELTRDEVAAFKPMGKDAIAGSVEDMAAMAGTLQNRSVALEKRIKKAANYLVVEVEGLADQNVNASYWLTNGSGANGIRSGTALASSISYITGKNTYLLTTTMGGGAAPKGRAALNSFRYSMLTHDRIITSEDVKGFCKIELGNIIKEIVVKRGTAISDKPKEGFIEVTYVLIAPQQFALYDEGQWKIIARGLRNKLETKSISNVEYRVQFQEVID